MDNEAKETIKNKIAPLVQSGQLGLFLGAGFSYQTPAKNGQVIPSTNMLIERILIAAGYRTEDAKDADLATAFSIGQDEIENFSQFLVDTFSCREVLSWQVDLLQHWWRRIYTTNIDNVIQTAVKVLHKQRGKFPDYRFYNYRDRQPTKINPLETPVVHLHGSIENLEAGFVFDNTSYADYAVRGGDWLYDAALQISHGNCVLIGSRFKESDLEVALRERLLWDKTEQFSNPNWIVLKSFKSIERKTYEKRGIVPIEATAEDFITYLNANLSILTPAKFIKRIFPHLKQEIVNSKSLGWFGYSFGHVATELVRTKTQKGLLSRFFLGDIPDWFYISNDVPAQFNYIDDLIVDINQFLTTTKLPNIRLIAVTGSIGVGKTTGCMILLKELSRFYESVYIYTSTGGIDIEQFWVAIRDLKGSLILFFDRSSENFYAISEIAKRIVDRLPNLRTVFIIEERENAFNKNQHHLATFTEGLINSFIVPQLSSENALLLANKLEKFGMLSGELRKLSRDKAANHIIDRERGYNGDLLATMCDISSAHSFREQLTDEYAEIQDVEAKNIFQLVSIVTAARMVIPLTYLAEVLNKNVSGIIKILNEKLAGKIYFYKDAQNVSARHPIIAAYHLEHFFLDDEKETLIRELMRTVSKKFEISDIREHPLAYRIYKSILSHHFLMEQAFPGKPERIDNVYSACQTFFAKDGIFWLQYGKFLHDQDRLDDAEHCFRKGLPLYDSFHLRHALGHVLMDQYVASNLHNIEIYNEGSSLLFGLIEERGISDPYPYTTLGHCYMNILDRRVDPDKLTSLKNIVNQGMRVHRMNSGFQRMVKRYFSRPYSAT